MIRKDENAVTIIQNFPVQQTSTRTIRTSTQLSVLYLHQIPTLLERFASKWLHFKENKNMQETKTGPSLRTWICNLVLLFAGIRGGHTWVFPEVSDWIYDRFAKERRRYRSSPTFRACAAYRLRESPTRINWSTWWGVRMGITKNFNILNFQSLL